MVWIPTQMSNRAKISLSGSVAMELRNCPLDVVENLLRLDI